MSCCELKSRSVIGLVSSIVLFVLVPKCPLCIAAYAGTLGVGLSLSGATIARDVTLAFAFVLVGVWLRGMVSRLHYR